MLKCCTSLWSADLVNLAADIKRVEPHSERFHLDVADGHYVKTLLFFPDLVAAIRRQTKIPLEIHLTTNDPASWIEPFVEAGADGFIFYNETTDDPGAVLRAIKAKGKFTGISLTIDEDVEVLEPYWRELDVLTLLGTAVGVKGLSMHESVPEKIRKARKLIRQAGARTEIQCDGGIRRESVPLMAAAGADSIVPGSLMFKEDPPAMRKWLASLPSPA